MKKILPHQDFFCAVFWAYFEFLKLVIIQNKYEKSFIFDAADKETKGVKGVRHKSFSEKYTLDFNLTDKKISGKILCSIEYKERSKKLFVTFKLKSPDIFIKTLKALQQASFALCAEFFNELAQRLLEALLPVETPEFNFFDYYFAPVIKCKKSAPQQDFSDDITCILYSIYLFRKNKFSFVRINADDILFLKERKRYCANYKNKDKKQIAKAISRLQYLGLIYAKKIKNFEWKFYFFENSVQSAYIVPKEIFTLNSKKHFEKYLAHLICKLAQSSKSSLRLKKPTEFLYKNIKYIKPSIAREKTECAFDELVKKGIIKNWQYGKIDENKLCKTDWIVNYKKLSIIFSL